MSTETRRSLLILDTSTWRDVDTMTIEELRAELKAAREQLIEIDKSNNRNYRMLRASNSKLGHLVCSTHTHTHTHTHTNMQARRDTHTGADKQETAIESGQCTVRKLLREISDIRAREQLMIQEMEAEEDRMAVSFTRQVESMRREREAIVNSMESESEAVVNRILQHGVAPPNPGEPPAQRRATTEE